MASKPFHAEKRGDNSAYQRFREYEVHGLSDDDIFGRSSGNSDNANESRREYIDEELNDDHDHLFSDENDIVDDDDYHDKSPPSKSRLTLNQLRSETVNPYGHYSYRIEKKKPPKSATGLKILKADIKDANNRVHELLIRLRMTLAMKAGLPCSIIDPSLHQLSEESKGQQSVSTKELLYSASSMVAQLQSASDLFISTMSTIYRPGEPGKVYLAFLLLNRILHPFSSDHSYVTHLLVSAVYRQVQDAANDEEIYSHIDSRIVIARLIFSNDAQQGLTWNPLKLPLPTVPFIPNETVLACLLRVYGVRRDVSSFFRAIWKPAIPSMIALCDTADASGSHAFKNIMSVAKRILDSLLRDEMVSIFPPPAISVCQSLFQVGGVESVHTYILNFLLLPNLVKILKGDHESIEAEDIQSKSSVFKFINQYYDVKSWWPQDDLPFNPVDTLIWLVWRLYTGAAHLDEGNIAILTKDRFFRHGPDVDMSAVPDVTVRAVVVRVQHRLDKLCRALLASDRSQLDELTLSKPVELLSFSLISKREATSLTTDLLASLEVHHENPKDGLYKVINDFKAINELFETDEKGEDLLLLSLPQYVNVFEDAVDGDDMGSRYEFLCNGLSIANRYEDALLRMMQSISRRNRDSLKELLRCGDTWYTSPEFDSNFKIQDVRLFNKHTKTSEKKLRPKHYGFAVDDDDIDDDPQGTVPKIDDIEHKSRAILHAEIQKSFRFGTPKNSVSAGTSIARKRHRSPKKSMKLSADSPARHVWSKGAKYTKSAIATHSNLLERTMAQRVIPEPRPPNRFDLDKEFMKSMREHDVIPTDEFLRGRQSRSGAQGSGRAGPSAPQPFPAHLRHLLRKSESENDDVDNDVDDDEPTSRFDISQLISDYKSIVSHKIPTTLKPARVDRVDGRELKPRVPEALPGMKVMAPTQSLLHKLDETKEFIDDIEATKETIHSQAFRPPGPTIVPSTGPRIPQYLLSEDEGYESRGSSRSSSRRSGSRVPVTIDVAAESTYRDDHQEEKHYMMPKIVKPTTDASYEGRRRPSLEYVPINQTRAPLRTKVVNKNEQFKIQITEDNDAEEKEGKFEDDSLDDAEDEEYPAGEEENQDDFIHERDDNEDTDADEGREYDDLEDGSERTLYLSSGGTQRTVKTIPRKRVWNRQEALKRFKTGFEVIKHGRSGYPKPKILKFDEERQEIVWTPDLQRRRSSIFALPSNESISSVTVADISGVGKGLGSDVFKKAGKTLDPALSLSIYTDKRTVDVIFLTTLDRDLTYKALELICEPFDNILFF